MDAEPNEETGESADEGSPEPPTGWVRVKVQACGICHSDSLTKDGTWPGIQYPRVPGHEVIGTVDAIGSGVEGWKTGQRIGVGWHGGHCGYCDACRRGEFFACQVALLTPGISFDGGYAEYMTAPAEALALLPNELSAVESAPLMCAGLTTFNALRNSVARELGAAQYIDSTAQNPAAELQKLGGAKVVIATVTNADAMAAVLGGLAPNGVFIVIGAAGPIPVDPLLLISGARSIQGWYSGTSIDSQDTLRFSALAGVKSMNEICPLAKANEAYERMMSGKARFRVVLDMGW